MDGNCHFLVGVTTTGMIALNLNSISTYLPLVCVESISTTATLLLLGGLIGSIFPDIDNPKSHMGKLSAPVSTVIGKIGEAFGKKNENHRGVFHDAGLYLVGLLLSYFYFPPLLGFFIGCVTHVFLDAFNPSGVPFLFGAKYIHLGRIYSGSKAGIVFTRILSISIFVIGITLHYFFYK